MTLFIDDINFQTSEETMIAEKVIVAVLSLVADLHLSLIAFIAFISKGWKT